MIDDRKEHARVSGSAIGAPRCRLAHRWRTRSAGLWFLALCLLVFLGEARAQQRVISTDAGITAIVEALGAAPALVAVDVTSSPLNASLPRVGYHRSLSAEGLLSLQPDLVLASEHAGPPQTLLALRSAGVQVTRLPAPEAPAELLANVRVVAAALERVPAGAALSAGLRDRLQELASLRLPPSPALLLREGDGGLRVAGDGTAGAALIDLLGATNAVDFPGYRNFSIEALLASDPDLLLVALPTGESAATFLKRNPALRFSRAARAGRLVRVDSASLVGGLGINTFLQAEELLQRLGRREATAR